MNTDLQDQTLSRPPEASSAGGREKFWGLVQRRYCWRLSIQGWLALAALMLLAGGFLFFNLHPFLAVTHRENAKFLVVEGWVHPFAFEAAAREFKTGGYQEVFATGGPMVGQGGYTSDSHTYASLGAEQLVLAGIPESSVRMVPSRVMTRDRTYGSAVALRDWLRDHQVTADSLNVLTENSHARRTWLLYQKAFNGRAKVGIISIANPDYAPGDWWKSSEGVRELIDECIAYVYARFVF